jgi:protein-S-isoprenylcysteine O-methyltransferase Ste14
LTGEPSEGVVRGLPGVSQDLIEQHQEAALFAAIVVAILGAIALFGLMCYRATTSVPKWLLVAALALSLLGGGLMIWTGGLGGQIRHTEARNGASITAPSPAAGKAGVVK